jgi:hypothetical protein
MSEDKSTCAPEVRYREIKPGYRVGDDGSVWSCLQSRCLPSGSRSLPGSRKRQLGGEWRELKPSNLASGHLHLWLGRGKSIYVHRLVLEAFIGPCPDGMECRHLDGDPGNNRLENLCWGTPQQNADDRILHGRSRDQNHSSKLTEADVREILALRQRGKFIGDIARWYNVTPVNIQAILYGRSWNHVTGIPKPPPPEERVQRKSLTPDQVHEILMLLKDGVSNNEIAVRFGVSSLTITHIKKGRTWKVLVERFNRAGEDTVR